MTVFCKDCKHNVRERVSPNYTAPGLFCVADPPTTKMHPILGAMTDQSVVLCEERNALLDCALFEPLPPEPEVAPVPQPEPVASPAAPRKSWLRRWLGGDK